MKKSEKIVRRTVVILCEFVTAATIVTAILQKQSAERILLAFATAALIFVPLCVERLFHCKLALPVYVFAVVYSIGSMLGSVNGLYYRLPGWDKVLHAAGGVMFVIVGYFLFELLGGDCKKNLRLAVLFALCFSMAISVAWEFYEFAADRLFGMDMQADSFVTAIHSYQLGDAAGETGSIDRVESVVINGERMPWDGYMDIGLHDTMTDMLLETLGAAAMAGIYLFDKGRHPMIRSAGTITRKKKDLP